MVSSILHLMVSLSPFQLREGSGCPGRAHPAKGRLGPRRHSPGCAVRVEVAGSHSEGEGRSNGSRATERLENKNDNGMR